MNYMTAPQYEQIIEKAKGNSPRLHMLAAEISRDKYVTDEVDRAILQSRIQALLGDTVEVA